MQQLNETGVYKVDNDIFAKVQENFAAGWLNETNVLDTIGSCYKETGYLLDTHTAVGYGVYKEYQKQTNDQTKTILLSTASPYKFPSSVYQAVTGGILDEYEAIDALNEKQKLLFLHLYKVLKIEKYYTKRLLIKKQSLTLLVIKLRSYNYESESQSSCDKCKLRSWI